MIDYSFEVQNTKYPDESPVVVTGSAWVMTHKEGKGHMLCVGRPAKRANRIWTDPDGQAIVYEDGLAKPSDKDVQWQLDTYFQLKCSCGLAHGSSQTTPSADAAPSADAPGPAVVGAVQAIDIETASADEELEEDICFHHAADNPFHALTPCWREDIAEPKEEMAFHVPEIVDVDLEDAEVIVADGDDIGHCDEPFIAAIGEELNTQRDTEVRTSKSQTPSPQLPRSSIPWQVLSCSTRTRNPLELMAS